ncbi:MAG: cation:proton antiporter [Thiobacillus sp.]|uniref:cation:proton antiporter n=1 Tax=Thiobacillus sp. TaxID=924 RepID=UPI002733FDAF|nr:cation:proton antiporter [Thiobacillus sp.]MDP3584751.1 cation:proton antiporter [Thiobacillus sp.]
MTILALFVFVYSLVGGRLARSPISGAIIFTAFGLALGPLGFGFLKLNADTEQIRLLAELTLALVLFTDAANSNLGVLRTHASLPLRLLLIGLPLTLLLGFGVGVLVFDGLTLLELAILAVMLAPTDAALGKAVVTNKSVPAGIREGLNQESGLNDGICVPVLLLLLAVAVHPGAGGVSGMALELVASQIGIGMVVGLALTLFGAWLFRLCKRREWISDSWRQVAVPALAVACFALAQWFEGSGFIAAFSGGLLFGWLAKHQKHTLLLAAEGTGDTLALITWVVFGAVVIARAIDHITWEIVLYAVLSLTLIRMLPVFLVLPGLGLSANEKLFVGWFGPRGLASIVFGVIVLEAHLPGGTTLVATVVCTILLSIVAHGLSAGPLAAVLKRKS